MPSRVVQRSAVLAACLSLLVSTAAFADVIGADVVGPEGPTFVDLGETGPGGQVSFDVDFLLTCRNGSHPARGSSIQMGLGSAIVPDGGVVEVDPGVIGPIPDDWPVAPEVCSGSPTLSSSTPATVTITAPTAIGDDYLFTILFSRSPSTGTTGSTSVSARIDVVADTPPVDTTAPVLHGLPTDRTVTTSASTAVVTWPSPTATDDLDPAPAVGCTPASGSSFSLGTTTVTCTATDAAGNSSWAGFSVTVVQASARFDQPVGNGGTFTVSSARTIPIKVELFRNDVEVTDGEAWIWVARCGGAAVRLGELERQAGRWQGHLDTDRLAPGCHEVTIRANGASFGGFELRIEGGTTATSSKPKKKG